MRKKVPLLILLLLFCNLFGLYSQSNFKDGYIISHKNDTVYGLIDFRGDIFNSQKCVFKSNKESNTKTYYSSDIKAYRFVDDKYYISKTILFENDSINVFIEYLLNGIADVYFFKVKNGEHYYIYKEDKGFVELKNVKEEYKDKNWNVVVKSSDKYKVLLTYFFSDCKEILPDIEYANISHKSLKNLTKKYHEFTCNDGSKCIEYEKEKKSFNFKFIPYIGINNNNLSLNSYYWDGFDIESQLNYSLGLILEIYLVKLNENLCIQLGLDLKNSEYAASKLETGINGWDTNISADFGNYSINSGVFLKYAYPPTIKIQPILKIGIVINNELNHYSNVVEKNIINDVILSENEYDYYPLTDLYFGINIGTGMQIRNKILIDFNYIYSKYSFFDTNSGYLNNNIEGTNSSFNMSIGFIF